MEFPEMYQVYEVASRHVEVLGETQILFFSKCKPHYHIVHFKIVRNETQFKDASQG